MSAFSVREPTVRRPVSAFTVRLKAELPTVRSSSVRSPSVREACAVLGGEGGGKRGCMVLPVPPA
eukprot:CAMPEP_0179882168 /NCGR_PEP_ID=MMETSP0982-20121206/27989_1 /TAXON_ID=483367 /ORGANISM="non described non described, Strain CCMP 2436" /LENGTH=64 /DNA_ID=CAMNT_0021776435 /DNA_START=153 /DNA_END=343 /DNA_ORIENTATION=-